jgi:hypothetical protein
MNSELEGFLKTLKENNPWVRLPDVITGENVNQILGLIRNGSKMYRHLYAYILSRRVFQTSY